MRLWAQLEVENCSKAATFRSVYAGNTHGAPTTDPASTPSAEVGWPGFPLRTKAIVHGILPSFTPCQGRKKGEKKGGGGTDPSNVGNLALPLTIRGIVNLAESRYTERPRWIGLLLVCG